MTLIIFFCKYHFHILFWEKIIYEKNNFNDLHSNPVAFFL